MPPTMFFLHIVWRQSNIYFVFSREPFETATNDSRNLLNLCVLETWEKRKKKKKARHIFFIFFLVGNFLKQQQIS